MNFFNSSELLIATLSLGVITNVPTTGMSPNIDSDWRSIGKQPCGYRTLANLNQPIPDGQQYSSKQRFCSWPICVREHCAFIRCQRRSNEKKVKNRFGPLE